ncbi:MAG: TPM domain-containing protein [Clostridia bacterium]|nr:TPM domain-containing protein [Clostridia bacterium]
MKRIISIIIAACLFIAFSVTGFAQAPYPEPTDNFFVNDFADILSSEQEAQLQSMGVNLYNASKAQVVVVTVDSLDGKDIDSYALGLARSWGIGDKDKDNGVLLLLSVTDREVKIEVGYGLEGALPDSKTGRILDTYGMDYFRVDAFGQGIYNVYNSLVNEVYIEYGMSPDEDYIPVEEDSLSFSSIAYVVFLIVVLVVVLPRMRFGFPFIFFGGPRGPRGFGGGGFGSGSGGGFGGFSGGGGGFGGGGSSRRF